MKNKRLLSLLLAFAMLVTLLVPLGVTMVSADEPTLITDQAGLAAMTASGNYKLANDVTITGTWRNTTLFKGTFDGDGHTITYAEGSTIRGGLFEQLQEGATVKNLYIAEGGTVHWTTAPDLPGNNGTACFGGLTGSIQASAGNFNTDSFIQNAANKVTIQNVHVNVTIYTEAGTTGSAQVAVGGIVGDLGLITRIENCSFSGSITDSTNRSGADGTSGRKHSGYGGMVGVIVRNCGTIEITKCINNGDITGYGNEGGILGYSRSMGTRTVVIDQCINNGAIECKESAASSSVGGIIGYAYAVSTKPVTVRYCINTGSIKRASEDVPAAGIIGGLRRDENTIFLTGNLQDSETNQGSQIAQAPDGTGDLVCENNYSIGGASGSSIYTYISNAEEYATAYATLNAAYPGIYGMYNDHITLAWAIPEVTFLYNQDDLAAMSATGNYKLANDITISGTWRNTTLFKGTFDGDGHTITYAEGSTIRGGLFEQLQEGAIVKNLYIAEGGTVQWTTAPDLPGNNGTACFGGLTGSIQASAGNFETDSFIQNAANKVTIRNIHVNVNLYTNAGTTGSAQVAIGGIVGDVGLTCRIENCSFSGSITDSTSRNGSDMIAYMSGYGGMVGVAVRNCGTIEIVQCVNNANITGYGQEGGILGYSRAWGGGSTGPMEIVIEQCVNNGTITCRRLSVDDTHHANVGGIAGYIFVKDSATASIVNNINNGAVVASATSGDSYAAAIVSHLRRGTANSFNLSGNATLSNSVTTNGTVGKYMNKPDGSGDLVYVNNQEYGATPAGVSAVWAVLNSLYPDMFVITKGNKISLAWVNNRCAYLDESNYRQLFSLALDGLIQLRIGVAVPGDIPGSLRLIVSKGGSELQNVSMADVYDAESGYYVVSAPILAKEMADSNTYTVTVRNGSQTLWTTNRTISVKAYAEALLSHSEYSDWHDLMRAMLKYGAAAQNLFDYHTGTPAADISGGITVDTASLPSHTVTGDRSFLANIRASLSLEAGTDLNFYFKPETPGANLTATVRKDGAVVSGGVVTEWVGEDGGASNVYFAVRIRNLAADQLDDWYDITVTDGSKSVTVHCSGLCWVKAALDGNETAATKTLAKGIALYANQAIASAGYIEPIVLAAPGNASPYYISYPAGADTYLKSTVLSFAEKMSRNGIYFATSSGDNDHLGKPIKIITNGSITGWSITFEADGNITVTGKDHLMAINGFRYLVDVMTTQTASGSYIIADPTDRSDTASAYTRSGWLLAAPAYENGTLASALYDEGTGLATDKDTTVNAERSYVMYISSTNATQFNTYANKLASNGYTLDASSSTTAKNGNTNLFKTYRRGTQVLFLYFDAQYSVARVIDDQASTPETEFEYAFSYNSNTTTDLILYGMKYSSQGLGPTDSGGEESTPNNGAFFIIRQADNSVMLIDGGIYLQATDAAVDALWNYLHTITGKAANETITISCWYVTHPHTDHYYMVSALLEKYHENLDLQRVMFNFPKYVNDKGYEENIRTTARAYYPDVMFMKCHTGQSIQLGSLTLDVLATHEDLVTASSGTVTFDSGNDMSTVLRITFPDGTRFMSMGDATEDVVIAGMINHFAASELNCKFFEVPHHGYNELESSQCSVFTPKYVLFPNYIYTDFPHPTIDTNNVKWRYRHCKNNHDNLQSAGATNFYYAGSGTYRLTIQNGGVSVTSSAVVY